MGTSAAEPLFPACSATTRAGRPCRFAARRETGLCVNHDPGYREQQALNVARGARNAALERSRRAAVAALPPVNLGDRAAVRALLEAVVALEITGAIPAARSRNLVRLAVAALASLDPGAGSPARAPRSSTHLMPRS